MIPGIVDSAVAAARSFIDEFPGDGDLASRWSATRGTWTKTADDAVTSTAASSYPLLSFNANTQRATVRTEGGTAGTIGWGAAFWVVDSNNWWAAVVDMSTYTCVVGSTTGCCACGDSGSGNDCSCPGCVCCNCTTGAFVAYAGTCTYPVYGTCYSYNLKLINSVSGSISTISTVAIAGDTSSTLTVGYVQVTTNAAGQITATAQMSTGGTVAQIQTTPVSPNRGRRYGVIITPRSNGTQAVGLERFTYAPA